LAKYESPQEEDGWKINSAEFNLDQAYQEKGKYSFLISIPGLKADDDINDGLEIGDIRVDLEDF